MIGAHADLVVKCCIRNYGLKTESYRTLIGATVQPHLLTVDLRLVRLCRPVSDLLSVRPPFAHLGQNGIERFAVMGERVLDPHRHFREDLAVH